MSDLKAYNGRDLQLAVAVISQFEMAGVSDIRVIRQRIEDDLRERARSTRLSTPKNARIAGKRADRETRFLHNLLVRMNEKPVSCPDCGRPMVYEIKMGGGEAIWNCKTEKGRGGLILRAGCGYSEYAGEFAGRSEGGE